MDIGKHWFWRAVVMMCVAWYSTITVYVAIRGFADIKSMLRKLGSLKHPEEQQQR